MGLRAAQVAHALIQWVLQHGAPPDNLVVLQVPDEAALGRIGEKSEGTGITMVPFREPDLDDELTAIAFGPEAWRLLSSLPLMR